MNLGSGGAGLGYHRRPGIRNHRLVFQRCSPPRRLVSRRLNIGSGGARSRGSRPRLRIGDYRHGRHGRRRRNIRVAAGHRGRRGRLRFTRNRRLPCIGQIQTCRASRVSRVCRGPGAAGGTYESGGRHRGGRIEFHSLGTLGDSRDRSRRGCPLRALRHGKTRRRSQTPCGGGWFRIGRHGLRCDRRPGAYRGLRTRCGHRRRQSGGLIAKDHGRRWVRGLRGRPRNYNGGGLGHRAGFRRRGARHRKGRSACGCGRRVPRERCQRLRAGNRLHPRGKGQRQVHNCGSRCLCGTRRYGQV